MKKHDSLFWNCIFGFVGVIAYATYTEVYPDGAYFRKHRGDDQVLITVIATLVALFWPFALAFLVLAGFVKLIIRIVTRLKEKHESSN